MTEPNMAHRNLKGVGGKRYFDIPGVVYPKNVIETKPGYNTAKGTPFTEVPNWGITTTEAAKILNSSYSSARVLLKRKRVKFRIVRKINAPPTTYWDRESVASIAKEKPPLVNLDETPQLIGPKEAADYLNISRSTICRAIASGFLHPIIVRIHSAQGPRKRSLLHLTEIQKLAKALQAKHLKHLKKLEEKKALNALNQEPPQDEQ